MYKDMFIYEIKWIIENGGEYVFTDPCCGDGYYKSIYGEELITATNKKNAINAIKITKPKAKIQFSKRICKA